MKDHGLAKSYQKYWQEKFDEMLKESPIAKAMQARISILEERVTQQRIDFCKCETERSENWVKLPSGISPSKPFDIALTVNTTTQSIDPVTGGEDLRRLSENLQKRTGKGAPKTLHQMGEEEFKQLRAGIDIQFKLMDLITKQNSEVILDLWNRKKGIGDNSEEP